VKKKCLGFDRQFATRRSNIEDKAGCYFSVDEADTFPCVPVSELDRLIDWGLLMQANNEIYAKSTDELNEDWIEKIKELKKGKKPFSRQRLRKGDYPRVFEVSFK